MTEPYLAGLHLAGRRVVVVGAGAVAERRVTGLRRAGADVVVVAPDAGTAMQALAESGAVQWRRRRYELGDLDGAWYVVAATDAPQVNAEVAADSERRRIFCVRADDAEAGTASTPATGRHDEVAVGVLGGGDPRRAAELRDGVLERLREGSLAAPPRRRPREGRVVVVGGGPGDPDLITVRGRRALGEADVVVVDRLAPRALLEELPAPVQIVDASKIPYGPGMAQQAINGTLVEHARAGRTVVRLKGGDPFVFGRGMEELLACAEAGVAVEVVPGLSSVTAVPALAGVALTHRGVAHEVTVASGHLAPDDPRSLVDWPALGRLHGTLVLLMAVEHLSAIARTLVRHGRAPATPVAVVQEGSLPGERRLVATLATVGDEVVAAGIRPPALVVVGGVVEVATRYHRAVGAGGTPSSGGTAPD